MLTDALKKQIQGAYSQFLESKGLKSRYGQKLMIAEIAIPIIFALVFSVYWHKKEAQDLINSVKIQAWFIGALRYWLAFSISVYGFAKIFQTQFHPSLLRDDMLVGGLNGFQLTWNFFAHSYILAVILGSTQIIGSVLILFRRTTLLGVVVLMPVMVNIVLINIFYDIAVGAFINSVLYTSGLTLLLLLRYQDLKKVFLDYVSPLPKIGVKWLVYIAKFVAIFGAALFIGSFLLKDNKPTKFVGKWNVDRMIKNGDTIQAGKWLTDSTAWTTIYIENGESIYLCPNPYLYDKKKSLHMDYKFVSKTNEMQIVYYKGNKPIDTTSFKINKYSGDKMSWHAIFHGDTLRMDLSRIKKVKKAFD